MLVFTSTVAPNLNTGDEFSRFSGCADTAASPAWYNFCLLVRSSHCSTVALTPAISSAPPQHKGHSYQYGPCLCDCCKRGLAHASCIFFFYKPRPRKQPTASQLELLEGRPAASAKGFSRCADEECVLHSCSPGMPPPGHKMENDTGSVGLKSG